MADSSWITELLWTFFVPFTVYQVRYYLSLSLSFGAGFRVGREPDVFAIVVRDLFGMR